MVSMVSPIAFFVGVSAQVGGESTGRDVKSSTDWTRKPLHTRVGQLVYLAYNTGGRETN